MIWVAENGKRKLRFAQRSVSQEHMGRWQSQCPRKIFSPKHSFLHLSSLRSNMTKVNWDPANIDLIQQQKYKQSGDLDCQTEEVMVR